jgi:hypothetical protein
MPRARFKKLFPKLKLTSAKKPKTLDARVLQLESEMRDLRSVLRELVETLEWELARDLDQDRRVGHVSAGRGIPKTARLKTFALKRPSRLERSAPLPPNIP